MRVRVRLFAVIREQSGASQIELDLAESATVADVRQALMERFPGLAGTLEKCLLAVNDSYASESFAVTADTEIACIPPVSGGRQGNSDSQEPIVPRKECLPKGESAVGNGQIGNIDD